MPSGLPMFAPLQVLLIVLWEWCLANADASSIENTAADIHALDGNFVGHYVHCEKVSRRLIFYYKNKRIPQRYTLVRLHIYFDTRVVFYLHFLSLIAKCYYCYYCFYYGNLILIAKTLLSQNSKMNRCYFVSTTLWLTELIKQLKNAKATFWRFISMYKVHASY